MLVIVKLSDLYLGIAFSNQYFYHSNAISVIKKDFKTNFQIIAAYLIVSTPPLIVIFRVNCSRGVLLIFSTSICAFVASRIALMLTPARPIILGIAFDIILKT